MRISSEALPVIAIKPTECVLCIHLNTVERSSTFYIVNSPYVLITGIEYWYHVKMSIVPIIGL